MRIGMPYYFEQWPRDRWEIDADLMSEAGVSVVRMGEFAWAYIEAEEGLYDFAMLDSAISVFADRGMSVILATPSPTYPPWLHEKHPDIHQVRSDGGVKEYGHRQDACKNHSGYRAAAMASVRALAERYAKDPRILAWQIDNELGNHGTEGCWCERCEKGFQSWIERRFGGDIESLNAAWGTAFWSQRYAGFGQVRLPRDTADRDWSGGQNPGLVLDFMRFSSDVQVRFLGEQVGIIRSLDPTAVITHNLMGGYEGIDYFELAKGLDLVSWDNYPFLELDGESRVPSSLPHALMRGLKRKNPWVMEQATGAGGLDRAWPAPEPGRMRIWAFQSAARGAELLVFFRWRSARFGVEQFWQGILPHFGVPGPRYEELSRLSRELKSAARALDGTEPRSRIAILLDWSTSRAIGIQPLARVGTKLREMAGAFARFLDARGLGYDCVGDCARLGDYDVLLVPSLAICSVSAAADLAAFVERGGLLVLGPMSGIKNAENGVLESQAPGPLAALAGVVVEETDAFSYVPGFEMGLDLTGGGKAVSIGLAEILSPGAGTATLARYDGRYYAGAAAATLARRGAGECAYLGTALDAAGLEALLLPLLERRGIRGAFLPRGLEMAVRSKGEKRYRFFLNHGDAAVMAAIPGPGVDLLTERRVQCVVEIESLGVLVVEEDGPGEYKE
ncbi:MAG: beta-galactosidase, partial [Spirochaetaceae bacterium]|nr:beta-galactosidase [Spirochaetaceae bacterium]